MSTDVLDRFYDSMQNVVLRDANGYPSVFVKHPKVNSSYFDSSLPNSTHPAFVYTDGEDDAILIGKYPACARTTGGTLYSLPNMPPEYLGTYEDQQTRIRLHGSQTGLTIADFGYIWLSANKYCKEYSVSSPCEGNVRDCGDDVVCPGWNTNRSVVPGDVRCYAGYAYTCLIAHTTSTSILPDEQPTYWKRGAKIGSTYVSEDWVQPSGVFFDNLSTLNGPLGRSLTGSGPISWYFEHDITKEADMRGNVNEWLYGIRMNDAKLQVMPYNDAGDPGVTYNATADSGWKEILPNGTDAGYTFVEPGTSGTIRAKWVSPNLVWTTEAVDSSEYSSTARVANLATQVKYDSNSGTAPSILYEYGLLPITGQPLSYLVIFQVISGTRIVEWAKLTDSGSSPFGSIRLNMYTSSGGTKRLYGSRARARYSTQT